MKIYPENSEEGGNTSMGKKKRKIAMLAAAWDCDTLEKVISGVKERIEELGWDLHVFMCFPVFGMENPENFGNYNIFSLLNYQDYEGFLLSVNGVHGYEIFVKYYPDFFSCGKPMVSLEREIDGITTIAPDGYRAVYRLVEHLITEHGCRTLNYVGGMSDHLDNIIRKKAYRDALTAHGILVEERRIRDYSFIVPDGRKAYHEFKELGMELADAVVCANDAMALGYCQAAEEDGKYPPEDFLITGYDNDDNARIFTPEVTSVDKKPKELGYVGCDELVKLIEGKKEPKRVLYEPALMLRGSCGCCAADDVMGKDVRELRRDMYTTLKEERTYSTRIARMRQDLALATTEGMFAYFMREIMNAYDIYGFAMCVNQNVYYSTSSIELDWKIGYEKNQCVIFGMKQKEDQGDQEIIKTRQLYPGYLVPEDEKTHSYLFTPIHRVGAGIGYLVVVDGEGLLRRQFIMNLNNSMNNAYSNLRNLENLRKINKRLDNIYSRDVLTDLYNRVGYMREGYDMYEKSKLRGNPLLIMFMDMDHLKYINDTFGHSAGDNALVLFAEVLKKVAAASEGQIAIRYGADEFLIIGEIEDASDADTMQLIFETELAAVNERENLPYQIEASTGYVITNPKSKRELDDYVKEADGRMYEVKKRNRKNREANAGR